MASSQDVKLCPRCNAILTSNSEKCGVCGADLRGVDREPYLVAVIREENAEKAARVQLRAKERRSASRYAARWIVIYLATAALVVSGIVLVAYSPTPAPFEEPSTFFWSGIILIMLGLTMLAYMVIGAGPTEGGLEYER